MITGLNWTTWGAVWGQRYLLSHCITLLDGSQLFINVKSFLKGKCSGVAPYQILKGFPLPEAQSKERFSGAKWKHLFVCVFILLFVCVLCKVAVELCFSGFLCSSLTLQCFALCLIQSDLQKGFEVSMKNIRTPVQ